MKAEVKKDSADVKAAKVLSSKFENALSSVKVTATKIKYGEGNVTVFTNDRLSPKQFSKLKSIAGKKLDLSTRGESWVLAYA